MTSTRGRKVGFAVHARAYGKVQAEPNANPSDQERRKGRRKMLVGCPSWAV